MKKTILKPLAVVVLTLVANLQAFGQEDAALEKAKTMAKELLEIRENVFVPIQKDSDKVSNLWYAKQSGQYDIVRALKDYGETTLEKTEKSIVQTKARLEALEELKKILGKLAEDKSLKDGFVKAAEENIDNCKIARDKAIKPFTKKRTENYNKYREQAKGFAEAFKTCLKEKGEHELTKEAALKYHSYDPVYGSLSTSFYDEHGSLISVSTALIPSSKPDKKQGLFLGKYPLTRKSSYGYTMHVGGSEVRITPRIKEWDQKQVEAAASDLIDFERLEKINPKK